MAAVTAMGTSHVCIRNEHNQYILHVRLSFFELTKFKSCERRQQMALKFSFPV